MHILTDEQLENLRGQLQNAPLHTVDAYLTDISEQIHQLERIKKVVASVHEEKMQEVNPTSEDN